jgi:uncharacterized repeat protein (TIGR02543 family)
LTLSGYEGYKITAISLSMKSNAKGGAGNFNAKAGSTTISSISTAAFNTASWYGSYSSSYVTVTPSMTDDDYEIQANENVVITIAATANSLYCQSYTITYEDASGSTPTCSTPTFDPAAGTHEGTQYVTITSTTGATIYYTTDGSTPSTSSSVYSDPIEVSADMIIKAYAVKSDYEDSEVAEAAYTITAGPDVTLDFTSNGWGLPEGNTNIKEDEQNYTDGEYTITLKGSSGKGYYYNSGKLLIGQSGAYIVLPAFNRPIEKITCPGVTGASSKVTWNIAKGTEYVSTAATGCTEDKTFEITNPEANVAYTIRITNANNLQISKIKIYLGAAAAVAKPGISGDENFMTSTEVSITCATDGATIYYTIDDTDPKTSETKQVYSEAFNVTSTTKVRAIATLDDAWSEEATSKTFTKITPKTVAEAIAAIPNQDDVVDNQYVSGIVCTEGTSVNASGQMTYYISDDGSETSRLQIYQGKNLDNTAFSAVTDLAIGDRVVVFGQLKNYKGTKEMNSGNYLVSKQEPAVAAPVFTPNGGGFMGETDVTITCATASNTIYYTLDGTTPSKSSTQYTAAIHLTETKTITAVAYVGEEHSIVVAKTFTYTSPMTVAEALEALDSESPINNAAVTGIISTAPTSNPNNGRLTYYISDDGSDTNELEVYLGYGLNGASFSAKTDLQVGDQVTVFGNLKIFSGSSGDVKEFDTGSRLLTFSRPEVAVTSVELTESATVKLGKTVTLTVTISPENATDKVVTWESSDTDIATVADGVVTGVAEGTATITVTTHDGGMTATCEVTVEDAVTFSNAGYEWQHVTSDAQLVAGKYFVIASDTKGKVANRTITSGYFGEESATFADDVIAYNGFGSSKSADESNAAVFQLGGNSTDGWTLTEVTGDNTGLLGVTAVKTVAWSSGTTTWSISLEDGDATIQNGTSTYGRFLHNVNSTRFTTYTSDPSATMLLPQLYVWAEKTFKLRYDANGGEDAPAATLAQNGKATVTDAQPTREGKIFNGWNANQAGTGASYAAGDEVSVTDADVTIYAQWRDPEQYTVSYNANGGTLIEGKTAIENETVTEGESYTVKANVYEKEGFIFGGWEYNGEVYAKGDELTIPAGNVEFVAKWNGLNVTEFVLVTDIDQLLDGDKVYIVAAGYDVAMSTQSGSIRTYVEISKSNGHVVVANDEPVEFTLRISGDKITLKDGDKYLGSAAAKSVSMNDDPFEWTLSVNENGEATLAAGTPGTLQYNASSPRFAAYTSTQKPVSIYKKVNTLRSVEAGTWGTFCPAKEVKYPTGASFFTLTYKEVHAGVPYKIFFDEIGEGESLEAGKPYLFISDGDIKGVETGSAASSSQDYNGFHGIVSSTPGVTNGKYSFTVTAEEEAAYKYYILYQGQIRLCGAGDYNIAVGRAYINMSELYGNYVAPAPGRRRVGMANPQAPQTPTDIDATANTSKAMKIIFNDQLLILRDGKLYDTTGRLVGNFE